MKDSVELAIERVMSNFRKRTVESAEPDEFDDAIIEELLEEELTEELEEQR